VAVAGTTATASDGTVLCPGDAHGQALAALQIIERALARVGASMADVVRTRVYLVRIEDFDPVGRAHGSVFGEIRPASTMIQVAGLVDAAHLVEIEVDAIVDDTAR
jgi:enamine deaminase RidA (YjgF/YER057c/UK114 family)